LGFKDKVKTVRYIESGPTGELIQLTMMAFNEAGFIVLDSQNEDSYNGIVSPGIGQLFYNKNGKIDSILSLLSDGTIYYR